VSSIPQKRCTKCGVEKPLSEFHRWSQSRDGHKPDCKACRKRETAAAYWREHDATLAKKLAYRQRQPGYMRRYRREPTRCAACGELKTRDDFYELPKRIHGLSSYCKQCYKARYKDHAEERQNYSKVRYKRRKEEYKARAYQWGKNHPERRRVSREKWRKQNPAKARSYFHTYRTRKAGGGGSYTQEEWESLCVYYDYRCLCCGETKPLTADHIVPVAKGGSSNISNIQPLCLLCNSRKGAKTIDYRGSKYAPDSDSTEGP
jgi:HNH endonuclease